MDRLIKPFAETGTRAVVPDAAQPDLSVSYAEGYTLPYGQNPGKNITRQGFNGILYDITNAVNELQTAGLPDWISPTLNGGAPFAYEQGALVRHAGAVWRAASVGVDSEPGVSGEWEEVGAGELSASVTVADDVTRGDYIAALADGTFKKIAATPTGSALSAVASLAASSSTGTAITHIQGTESALVVWVTGASVYAAVASVAADGSLTIGAAVTVDGSATATTCGVAWDSAAERAVIGFISVVGGVTVTTLRAATLSGSGVALGMSAVVPDGLTKTSAAFSLADTGEGVALSYSNTTDNLGRAVMVTGAGGLIAYGTQATFFSGAIPTGGCASTWDKTAQRLVMAYREPVSTQAFAVAASLSSGNLTFGAPSSALSVGAVANLSLSYDALAGGVALAYRDGGSGDFGYIRRLTTSGLAITAGSATTIQAAVTTNIALSYYPPTQSILVAYSDAGNSSYGTFAEAKFTGGAYVMGAEVVFSSASTNAIALASGAGFDKTAVAFNATTPKIASYKTSGNVSNYRDLIGIAVSDALAGQPCPIILRGGIDRTKAGLTTGAAYYLTEDGALTTALTPAYIGQALAADKLFMKGST